MKSIVAVVVAALLAAAPISFFSADDVSAQTRREIVETPDSDYFGFDLRSEKDLTLDACKQLCLTDSNCKAFTYNTKVSWCFLKSDFDKLGTFAGAIAGKVVEVAFEPELGAAPELTFIPAGVRDQAISLMNKARKGLLYDDEATVEGSVAEMLVKFNVNDAPEALRSFEDAVSLEPENLETWRSFARRSTQWLASQGNNYQYRVQEMATSAAINAYRLTRKASDRAQALAVLAEALEQRSLYRPAILAYEKSLELVNSGVVTAQLASLRERKGFRVTGNSVDAENATPRLCVQFSEELVKNGVDYANFVEVSGNGIGRETGAIVASGKQICAEGLQHGETYRMTLRSGLPSSVGEVLNSPVTINSYVRDREASLRFTGQNFVLPANGRHSIPIVGVNASAASLKLFRVGDRSLAQLLSSSDFLGQLEGYSIDRVRDDLGEPVWEGTIELGRELNKDTVTGFPVDEALPQRKPGIYVLTAEVAGKSTDEWDPRATQWFLVSDLGLTSYSGDDGLTVFVRSLDSAKPVSGVELALLARNNEQLGTATTDSDGRAHLSAGLMRGTAGLSPQVLTARTAAGDFVFLDMQKAGFDLSDRGVDGRETPGPVDLFTYLDRGIYRPGETVNAVSLVRDDGARAGADLPLTAVLERPDGVEAKRIVSPAGSLGGHVFELPLQGDAMRGVWRLKVHTDPDRDPISDISFLVEDFIPDRIEFDLKTEAKSVGPGNSARIEIEGRYLYGAPAAGLGLEGEIRLKPIRERTQAPGYVFGLADEAQDEAQGSAITLDDLDDTDDNGKSGFDAVVASLPSATRPLEANIVIRMKEEGGRAVERTLTLPVNAQGPMIGIKPDFADNEAKEGSDAAFTVLALDRDGNRIDLSGLRWTLNRIERNYQWYRDGSYWRYETTELDVAAASGTVDAKAGDLARLTAPVKWGRYRLDIESEAADGPASSYFFNAGWYVEASSAETPDALDVALDKESYVAGETAKLRISPRSAGEVLVVVGANTISEARAVTVGAEGGEVEIPVSSEWGAGAYVTATLLRPGNAGDSRMPSRAIGTAWLKVAPGERQLQVAMELPKQVRPGEILDIPVTIANLTAGEEAFVTVAAVDVGILNLTRYEAPNPVDHYFSQRKLGLEIRDLYGKLIDGSAGALGRLRSGGDGPALTAQGNPPTEKLLSLFSGIVKADANGKVSVGFELPQFNGTARVMAVAWSKSAVGNASGDVIIRDPVVVSASLPKVMAPQDKAQALFEIHNTDGEAGEFAIVVDSSGVAGAEGIPATLTLAKGERKAIDFTLTALKSGDGKLSFTVTRDGQQLASVTQDIFVRPQTLPVNATIEFPLASNGASVKIDRNLLSEYVPEGASLSMSVRSHKSFDVAALLTRLDRYPYGCAEQTTSRALPLLYLSDLDAPKALTETKDLQKVIADAVTRLLSFQSSSGSFGMWGPDSGELWLDAYVTDFLTRAVEKGHAVPSTQMRLALQNLQNTLAYEDDLDDNGNAIAYALYVLARNRLASVSDLRYYADTRLEEFDTPLARAHLASALALYNDSERSSRVFLNAYGKARTDSLADWSRADYGSGLRDGAAILALASETRAAAPMITDLVKLVEDELATRAYTSTQEDAWLTMAARAIQDSDRLIRLEVDGQAHEGALSQTMAGGAVPEGGVTIANKGSDVLVATVSIHASPVTPLPAGGDGFEITRTYYTLDGEETNPANARQNERYVVVLDVTETNSWPSRLLVTDLLPGGFEIDNPRIMNSANLASFDWLGETEVAHTEFRKDRFVAAFNRTSSDDRNFQFAYVVRATTPGTYAHPAASVEDMYRPEFAARTATGFMQVTAAR